MKITGFWDVMPYNLAEVYRCFGGILCPIFKVKEWYIDVSEENSAYIFRVEE
jgi:hypothetical protein